MQLTKKKAVYPKLAPSCIDCIVKMLYSVSSVLINRNTIKYHESLAK